MAVQILWKDGKEPQDQDNCFGKFDKSRPLATYTDAVENEDVAVEIAEGEQTKPECQSTGISSESLGEIITRASERLAQEQRFRRPVEESTRQANSGKDPKNKQQKGQVVVPTVAAAANASQTVASRARIVEMISSDDELYLLAQKRMEARAKEPLVIESDLRQHQLVMMSRAVRGSVVVEIDAEPLPRSETKPVPTTVVRFPLSEERQRADEFYRATGIRLEDFIGEITKPGWTVAEMISPRENAWRIKMGFYDCVYNVELMKLKFTKAVGEFLHKKRPYRADIQQAQAQLD